jgi:hypothetical protein
MKIFFAKRVSRSRRITLNANLQNVFCLFTPEEEKKWATGWKYKLVYPPNDKPQKNFIFTTSTHDHKQSEAIWIISKYCPEQYQIEYYRIEPEVKIGFIEIRCSESSDSHTIAKISYTYTALSELGNDYILKFNEDYYQKFMDSWQHAINYYLETGKTLPLSDKR